MIRVKVEVTSGLHAGAVWEFSNGEVTIGGSADCSVFLCDQELPDYCIKLKIIGNRVLLRHIASGMQGISELEGRVGKWVYPDQKFQIECNGVQFSIQVTDISGLIFARFANVALKKLNDSAEVIQDLGMKIVLAVSLGLGFISTVIVLLLGTSGKDLRAAEEIKHAQNKVQTAQARPVAIPNTMVDSFRQEIQAFLNSRKIRNIQISVKGDSIELSAKMSRLELSELEGLMSRLAQDYGSKVSFKAQVGLTDEQLAVDSIDIRSVSFGAQPVIMLGDGDRLFLGSYYKNLKLISVTKDGIVLAGKSSYSVPL